MTATLTRKNRKGFTLIELIVVIGILVVLSVLAAVAYGNLTQDSRDAANNADAAVIARSLNTFNAITDDAPVTALADSGAMITQLQSMNVSNDGSTPFSGVINLNCNVAVDTDRADDIFARLTYDATLGMWRTVAP